MANGQVGTAWVDVKPKVDGNPEAVGKEIGSGISNGAKGTFAAGAVAMGNILSNALTSVASTIGDQFAKTFWNYADFEQLSGGVEKIFDQANTTQILKDAQGAFKDLNMSANEYLSSINQVGATFAQTMGDQKGYDTARKGMLAISDYASGTGRDLNELNDKFSLITRSTSSYQSIADQFSGILPATSADFLEQAKAAGFLSDEYTKLTEVPVAEYQEAVTQMLEKGVADMGLAGNTAKESATTLSGSIAMLSGSWDNFLTAIGDGGRTMDLSGVTDGLLEALGAVALNVVPAIARIGETIALELPAKIAESFVTAEPAMIETIGGVFGESGTQAATSFFESLNGCMSQVGGIFDDLGEIVNQAIQPLGQLVAPVFSGIASIVSGAMNTVLGAISGVTGFISENVSPLISELSNMITPVIDTITSDISSAMSEIFGETNSAFGGIGDLVSSVWPAIADTIKTAVSGVLAVVRVAWPMIKTIASTAFNAVKSVVQTVWPAVSNVIKTAVNTAKSVVSTAVNAIKGAFRTLSSIASTVRGIFNSVKQAITKPIEDAKATVKGALDKIKSFFPLNIGNVFSGLKLPHFNDSGGSFPWGVGGKGSMPSWSVSWYARGGILENMQLIGAGERGTEFIWPAYDPYMSRYAKAIASNMPTQGNGITVNFTYNGEGDATDAVNLLTSNLRQLRATGAF